MSRGRMLVGNFLYVFASVPQGENPVLPEEGTSRFAKKRQKILKEFEIYARMEKAKGRVAYGAIYNFPTESGARQWVASRKLPAVADMTLTVTGIGLAKVHRR